MLRTVALLSCFISSLSYACDVPDCDPSSGLALDASCLTLAWDEPALRKALTDLDAAYARAWDRTDLKDALETAQRAWIDYRDGNCQVMSDRPGQASAEAQAQCLRFMTNERIRELRLLSYPSVTP